MPNTNPRPTTRTLSRVERQLSSLRSYVRRSDRHGTAIYLGDSMNDQLQQESLSRSSRCDFGSARGLVGASVARLLQQEWYQQQEREWEGRLRDMQKCICDLLYENQRLREDR